MIDSTTEQPIPTEPVKEDPKPIAISETGYPIEDHVPAEPALTHVPVDIGAGSSLAAEGGPQIILTPELPKIDPTRQPIPSVPEATLIDTTNPVSEPAPTTPSLQIEPIIPQPQEVPQPAASGWRSVLRNLFKR